MLLFIGTEMQYNELNKILSEFNVSVHPQLKGGLYTAIGGFYKWHFFYFSYNDFLNLFLSFILSVLVFYILFQYLIEEKIITFQSKYQNVILLLQKQKTYQVIQFPRP